MRKNIAVFCCFLGILACNSNDPMRESTQKRLYQVGCAEDSNCERNGVCRQRGIDMVCYPACQNQCEGGMCIDGACVPSCGADGSCPEALACDSMNLCSAASIGIMDAGQDEIILDMGTRETDLGAAFDEPSCASNGDCFGGLRCITTSPDNMNGACAPPCGGAFDCEGNGGRCVDDINSSGMTACRLPCPPNQDDCPAAAGFINAGCAAMQQLCAYDQ